MCAYMVSVDHCTETHMPFMYLPSDKQIEAAAYQLAERLFKLIGYSKTTQDIDDLADELSVAIHKFFEEHRAPDAR